jgi:hypothetical protein
LIHRRTLDFPWVQRLKNFREFRNLKTGTQWDPLKKEEKEMKSQIINSRKTASFKLVQDLDRHKIYVFHKLAKFRKDSPGKVLHS